MIDYEALHQSASDLEACYSYASSASGLWVHFPALNVDIALSVAHNETAAQIVNRHSGGRAKVPRYGVGDRRHICSFKCRTN